ncbi:MAG: enoyl-CoA hydratase/isomerase family protein [bacterium]
MNWETLRLEGSGAVRHLVLSRPEKHNAIDNRMLRELTEVCLAIEELPDCRCVIVRGEGPSFSSGADLSEAQSHGGSTGQTLARAKAGARAIDSLTDLGPITVAAVHGHAIGGGACLAMACDFRIGARGASVSIREASLGLSLSWHSVPNVVHLVGATRAKEMIIFGEAYPAEKMLEYGFFDQVVAEGDLLPTAEALAQKVARQPPLPVRMTKASVNAVVKALDRAVSHLDSPGVAFTAASSDSQRARQTFFSGETAEWENG